MVLSSNLSRKINIFYAFLSRDDDNPRSWILICFCLDLGLFLFGSWFVFVWILVCFCLDLDLFLFGSWFVFVWILVCFCLDLGLFLFGS